MRSGFLNACPPSEASVSSSSTGQEKGIRNKRKFRTDHIQQPSVNAPQSLDAGHEDGNGECGSSWTLTSCSLSSGDVSSCITDSTSCFSIGGYIVPHTHTTHPLDANMPPSAAHGARASGFCNGYCKEETEYVDFQEPDWDNHSESQLEEILLNMLDALYRDAVGKIVSRGYSEKDSLDAVLKNGRWNGKDALTSVVDSSLTWLQSGEARQGVLDFTNLKDMERHVLAEMVCLLRKVRPFLSKGDAMWCLLVCDLNLLLACAMEDDAMTPPTKDAPAQTTLSLKLKTTTSSSTHNVPSTNNVPSNAVPLPQQAPRLSQAVAQLSNGQACKPPLGGLGNLSRDNRSAFSTPSFSSSPVGKVAVANRQPNSAKSSSSKKNGQPPPTIPQSNGNSVQEPQVQTSNTPSLHKVVPAKVQVAEQKTTRLKFHTCKCANGDDPCNNPPPLPAANVKSNVNPADICAILTKEKHMLKILRNHCLAQSFQPTSEACVLEKGAFPEAADFLLGRLKCGGCCVHDEDGKNVVIADIQTGTKSCPIGFAKETWLGLDAVNGLSSNETELCLATSTAASAEIASSLQLGSYKEASTSSCLCHAGLADRILGWSGVDGEQRKTEMLLQLIDRIKYLESQLQEWSEWAQQKVMQAAQRLRKDSSELKALRSERDEYARLKKEKQTLDETTTKKLSEMENALRKALNQVERANTTARRLKAENKEARDEMETAKQTAAEYVSACQEVAKKENKSVKKAQAWEKQKTKLQDELAEEKRKLASILQQLAQAKQRLQQAEVRWTQEKKAKEEALALLELEKRGKEQVELASKRQEETIQRKAEVELQCHRHEVQKLQSEIAHLKASIGLQPAMTWSRSGLDISEVRSAENYKKINERLLAEIANLRDSQREIQRDRECVMCMNEEMSIVFLPCAHQVICIKCNELHQKRGLKDCPSCRAPIKQRIRVYGVNST